MPLTFIGHLFAISTNHINSVIFAIEMNIDRLTYRKEQLYRFLLTFTMVLSLFSVSGPVGLSSIQLQNTSTECLWTEKQNTFLRSVRYTGKQAFATLPKHYVPAGSIKYATLLTHSRLHTVKFRALRNQFEVIKSGIAIACGFTSSLTHKDEPAIV